MSDPNKRPIVLTILDGWGCGTPNIGNAITNANLPTIRMIEEQYPSALLHASGISVGVLWGEEGNSETGHITIGAGRIVYQYITRIIFAIRDGSFFSNPVLLGAAQHVKTNNSTLHLMGLVSSGSVHSYIDHVYALFDFVKNNDIKNVALHIFTDGKDAPPTEGKKFVEHLTLRLEKEYPTIQIASLIGRTYSMDRNNNWDRIEKTYNLLVKGEAIKIQDPSAYLADCYAKDIFDSSIEPALVTKDGSPPLTIQDNDAVIFFNFREDSARQISHALTEDAFTHFERTKLNNLYYVGMTRYEDSFNGGVLFEPPTVAHGLGEELSLYGKKQLRVAETEKYAHVTYFFNGGRETPFEGEERILVPSLLSKHFDETPVMSAPLVADTVIKAIEEERFDIIIANFANADMVGHTGNYEATIRAVEAVDKEVNRIMQTVLKKGGIMLITADHGNADRKIDPQSGMPISKHSLNPVPLYLIGDTFKKNEPPLSPLYNKSPSGFLADVAPTLLDIMDIPKPTDMTGNSLLPLLTS
jgi:2,3-bisphosphoglycerate-independent phosphoglycerate mutase